MNTFGSVGLISRAMRLPVSIIDLAESSAEMPDAFRSAFEVDHVLAAPLQMSERAWAATFAAMHAPRHEVEVQHLVFVRDRALGFEAIVNPLRLRRRLPTHQVVSNESRVSQALSGCRWCDPADWHVTQTGLWRDDFGEVLAHNGRIRASPNWSRQAPISGLVIGDEGMHDFLTLARQDFVGLFEGAELYISKTHHAHSDVDHFLVYMNGGPRSAATVEHAHLQVVGRGHLEKR